MAANRDPQLHICTSLKSSSGAFYPTNKIEASGFWMVGQQQNICLFQHLSNIAKSRKSSWPLRAALVARWQAGIARQRRSDQVVTLHIGGFWNGFLSRLQKTSTYYKKKLFFFCFFLFKRFGRFWKDPKERIKTHAKCVSFQKEHIKGEVSPG